MLLVKNTEDLPALNLESLAGGNRSGSRQSKAGRSGNRLFPSKFACGDKCYRSLFAAFRNDGKACATLLKIENGVSGFSLRKQRENNGCFFLKWVILRPNPALARKAAASNAIFRASTT